MADDTVSRHCFRLARQVSDILTEVRKPRDDTTWIEAFPSNCCDLASSVLLVVFDDHGYSGFQIHEGDFIYARRKVVHQWLQRQALVVDVTTGQFPDLSLPSLICGPSPWHENIRRRILSQRNAETERCEVSNFDTLVEIRRRWPTEYPKTV